MADPPPSSSALLLGGSGPPPLPAAALCLVPVWGAGISVQTAAVSLVSSMRSSCENLWSASKSVVSPAGPPTANRAVRGTPASLLRLSCLAAPLPAIAATRCGGPDSFAATGARAFSKKEKAPGMTAQSIDLRQASDPRIERVGDRLGRSALIDQRQRDARE